MVQLLIEIADNPKAVYDQKKTGDVVTIKKATHKWSPMEKLPYFLVVSLDISEKEALKYLAYDVEEVAHVRTIPKAVWLADAPELAPVGGLSTLWHGFKYKPTVDAFVEDRVILKGVRDDAVRKTYKLDVTKLLTREKLTLAGIEARPNFEPVCATLSDMWNKNLEVFDV